ncbi:TOPRIM nucleotidyl transferase/hydrolase domain-containing protein [Catenulispora pinisilvae]|uniref:TOPRIM nucleotidyl transferase/hydrolase domain-containing protein n=1 Tax=Catenulispora pinisilvae TaxID=2705253 RepID=UPI001891248D|nr:TOPRIM nucleotidyl transferase/hydrolase domain-containing protein [Catenulispora pinisilvae]
MRAAILVEGVSDQAALHALARRRNRDLAAEGVEVLAMDGATNAARYLHDYGPQGRALKLAGLFDEAEERFFRLGLERAGLAPGPKTEDLEEFGFFVCRTDLEDELIRAVGAEQVLALVAAEGEERSFRTLQRQPAMRDKTLVHQLRRMMGGRSGGKERWARLLAETVPLDRVPYPLDAVLAQV